MPLTVSDLLQLPYGTLTDDEMMRMPVGEMQDEGGLLFLWVTGRAMELGRECLKAWGCVLVSLSLSPGRSASSRLTLRLRRPLAQVRAHRRARVDQDESTAGLDTNRCVRAVRLP